MQPRRSQIQTPLKMTSSLWYSCLHFSSSEIYRSISPHLVLTCTSPMGLGDEDQRGVVPFLSHRLRLPRLTWFVAVDVDLGPPAEVVCVCLST